MASITDKLSLNGDEKTPLLHNNEPSFRQDEECGCSRAMPHSAMPQPRSNPANGKGLKNVGQMESSTRLERDPWLAPTDQKMGYVEASLIAFVGILALFFIISLAVGIILHNLGTKIKIG